MLQRFLKQIIITLFLLINTSLICEGFCAGTVVKTGTGYKAIEDLKKNDYVVCSDFKNSLIMRPVIHIVKKQIPHFLQLYLHDECITVAPDHLFYTFDNKWIRVQDITPQHTFLNNNQEKFSFDVINYKDMPTEVYVITVADYHNFFVTTHDILVHNFFPITIGIAIAFGSGGLEVAGLTASIGIVSLAIESIYRRHTRNKIELNNSYDRGSNNNHNKKHRQITAAGCPPEDPRDPKDNWNGRNNNNHKNNEWKKNNIHQKDFFKSVENQYEHWRDGIYKRKSKAQAIHKAEYLEWDRFHNDVEAYDAQGRHLGSLDPATLENV